MNNPSVGTVTTTATSFALAQNLVSTLAKSNQPVQDELQKITTAFKEFMEEIREEQMTNRERIASLEAQVIQLTGEKKASH